MAGSQPEELDKKQERTMTFLVTRDDSGAVAYGLYPKDVAERKQMLLDTNVAQTWTVPEAFDSYEVVFGYQPGATVWVSYDGDPAEIPSGAITDTNSEMLPATRRVRGGTEVSLITSDSSAQVGIIAYGV
jgi:hypothetical protein